MFCYLFSVTTPAWYRYKFMWLAYFIHQICTIIVRIFLISHVSPLHLTLSLLIVVKISCSTRFFKPVIYSLMRLPGCASFFLQNFTSSAVILLNLFHILGNILALHFILATLSWLCGFIFTIEIKRILLWDEQFSVSFKIFFFLLILFLVFVFGCIILLFMLLVFSVSDFFVYVVVQ